jgi:homoserine O-acetyltransferase/O-succinyltransferase
MKLMKVLTRAIGSLAFILTALPGLAADYPAPQEGSWVVHDFRFHSGEVLPELRLHYTTVGAATGEPVLILHGTTQSGANMLTPAFAGELFGPGQPLDASRYYIIVPDAIGTGKSSKPSDGLRTSFPQYNYDDMVDAQYRLVTEHLGVRHLRLVLGYSMGGMHTWIWAEKYPDGMDVAVPMASLPTEMSGRNWMTRRLIIDAIRNDPEWMNGHYTQQPRSLQFASVFYGIATNGGNQGLYKAAPTREKADQLLNQRLKAPFSGDANDHLYPVGRVARLQRLLGPGAHPGGAVGDQLGGRRAQPARTRGAGPRDHAREKRPCAADPRQRPDRGPRHGRPSEILETGPGGAAANRAARGEIVSLGGQTRWRLPCRSHHAIEAPRSELDAYLVERIIPTASLLSVVQAVRVE